MNSEAFEKLPLVLTPFLALNGVWLSSFAACTASAYLS